MNEMRQNKWRTSTQLCSAWCYNSPGLVNILATITPFPIFSTNFASHMMHRIAFVLSALIVSVNACYYCPGPVNTCIISEFDCSLLSTCRTLANNIATDTKISNKFFFDDQVCYVAVAVSCQNAAEDLSVDLSTSICDSASVASILKAYGLSDFAASILPTGSSSARTSSTTVSQPDTNTPLGQDISRVAPLPVEPIHPVEPAYWWMAGETSWKFL